MKAFYFIGSLSITDSALFKMSKQEIAWKSRNVDRYSCKRVCLFQGGWDPSIYWLTCIYHNNSDVGITHLQSRKIFHISDIKYLFYIGFFMIYEYIDSLNKFVNNRSK